MWIPQKSPKCSLIFGVSGAMASPFGRLKGVGKKRRWGGRRLKQNDFLWSALNTLKKKNNIKILQYIVFCKTTDSLVNKPLRQYYRYGVWIRVTPSTARRSCQRRKPDHRHRALPHGSPGARNWWLILIQCHRIRVINEPALPACDSWMCFCIIESTPLSPVALAAVCRKIMYTVAAGSMKWWKWKTIFRCRVFRAH